MMISAPSSGNGLAAASTPLLAPGRSESELSIALATNLYRIDKWGDPYFSINSSGNISVRLHDKEQPREIDLLEVVKEATGGSSGLRLPLLVRFPDLLRNRLESLQYSFNDAMKRQGYQSIYRGVYPVKCNQDRFIVEDIVNFGAPFGFGLEAGSKPELLLAMTCLSKDNYSPDAFLICNGFKDNEYISLALIAAKLEFKVIIVLELEEELDIVIDLSKKLGVKPVIGVRAKLQTKNDGHFGPTSGTNGKFGLTTDQIFRIATKLKSENMLSCLQLLHFHMGSQIRSTEILERGVSEAAQIYTDLVGFGAPMGVIDVGGGLGVDYDGSKSINSDYSVGYTIKEYADSVVRAVGDICDSKGVEHPIICSESGRAIVSHHSILIFNVFSAAKPDSENDESRSIRSSVSSTVSSCYRRITKPSVIRAYHVNLSIFTSIPDFWGIGHLFPIIPIHRLDERPNVRGVLSDLTCDSDGVMDKFIGGNDSLLLHELEEDNEGYYLGMFLGGAYQEALGGHHNLFGGPGVVRVTRSDGPHGFVIKPMMGRSCGDVLRVMQYDPEDMKRTLRERAEKLGHGTSVDSLDRSFDNMPYLVMEKDRRNANENAGASSSGVISVDDRGENGLGDGGVESFYM